MKYRGSAACARGCACSLSNSSRRAAWRSDEETELLSPPLFMTGFSGEGDVLEITTEGGGEAGGFCLLWTRQAAAPMSIRVAMMEMQTTRTRMGVSSTPSVATLLFKTVR